MIGGDRSDNYSCDDWVWKLRTSYYGDRSDEGNRKIVLSPENQKKNQDFRDHSRSSGEMSDGEDDVVVLNEAVIGSPAQDDETYEREENEENGADEERNEVVERDLIMVIEDEAADVDGNNQDDQNDDCDGMIYC